MFRPEFLNRLDETVVFHPLENRELTSIAKKLLRSVGQRMADQAVRFLPTEAAVAHLVQAGTDKRYGARPLRRLIRSEVENPAAELLLREEIRSGSTLYLEEQGGKLTLVPLRSSPTQR